LENPKNPNSAAAREFLAERYKAISQSHSNIGKSERAAIYIDALARSYDPQSIYWSPEVLAPLLFGNAFTRANTYRLGLTLEHRRGDMWIADVVGTDSLSLPDKLRGCRLVAIEPEGRPPQHLVGLLPAPPVVNNLDCVDFGDSKSMLLHLDDPATGRRHTISWECWLRR
jgi:hypothetical protein